MCANKSLAALNKNPKKKRKHAGPRGQIADQVRNVCGRNISNAQNGKEVLLTNFSSGQRRMKLLKNSGSTAEDDGDDDGENKINAHKSGNIYRGVWVVFLFTLKVNFFHLQLGHL